MTAIRTVTAGTVDEVCSRIAQEVAEAIVTEADHRVVIGLCGGRSIVGVLDALSRQESLRDADWGRLELFLVDERRVPLSDPRSNYHMLRARFFEALISDGRLQERQLHPFEGDVSDYERQLLAVGGRFHVALFGVGEDGHIASLFSDRAWPEEVGFFVFDDSPKPPSRRMSCTPELVRTTKLAIGLFLGAGKHHAYGQFTNPDVAVSDCPAKLLRTAHSVLIARI